MNTQHQEKTTFNTEGFGNYELSAQTMLRPERTRFIVGNNKLHYCIPLPQCGATSNEELEVTFVLVLPNMEKREFKFKGKDLLIVPNKNMDGVTLKDSEMANWIHTPACPVGTHYRDAFQTGNLTLEQARFLVAETLGRVPSKFVRADEEGTVALDADRAHEGILFMLREFAAAHPNSFLTSRIDMIEKGIYASQNLWMSLACVLSLAPVIEAGIKRRLALNASIGSTDFEDSVDVLVNIEDEFQDIDFETWLPLVLQMIGRPDLQVNLYVLGHGNPENSWNWNLHPATVLGEGRSDLFKILGIADGRMPLARVSYALNNSRIVRTPHMLSLLVGQLENRNFTLPTDCIDAAVTYLVENRDEEEDKEDSLIWDLDRTKEMMRSITPAAFTVYADAALEVHRRHMPRNHMAH